MSFKQNPVHIVYRFYRFSWIEVFVDAYHDFFISFRVKTDDMETLSTTLKEEATAFRQEEENVREYKAELDLLLAEKLHHVEILRQIHSDINMVSG